MHYALLTRVTLVATDVTTSDDQLNCLTEWSQAPQTINVAGQPLQVFSGTPSTTASTTAKAIPATQTPTVSNITWIYAVIAIVVVGIIIVILLVIVILVVRRRDKPARYLIGTEENRTLLKALTLVPRG